MRKISNFCGIFATLFVTTTMVLLVSCSQDDDNYDSDMYTLAEMGTRLGGGDPGGGGPAPVNINVLDSVTEENIFYFYPDTVFNSSNFQHSPFVAINPSLYGGTYIEAGVEMVLRRINDVPTVTSFTGYPIQIVSSPTPASTDSIFGFVNGSEFLTSAEFEITNVYLQPDDAPLPRRYILYATGQYYKSNGDIVPCTAFIPNRLYH